MDAKSPLSPLNIIIINKNNKINKYGCNLVVSMIWSAPYNRGPSNNQFEKIIFMLKELEKFKLIKEIKISIIKLPLGRKFSYLNNGLDRRKCLLVNIIKINGEMFGIIEVEREGKSLSTLIVKSCSEERLDMRIRNYYKE